MGICIRGVLEGKAREGATNWSRSARICIREEPEAWGHPGGGNNEPIIKTGNARALVALRNAVAQYHGGKITPERAAAGESQSNCPGV